ncbi:histone deacetylase [Geodermatophilaceae bacterium NBWT11]|nr:histone deacetylase [Geodermatophilaceae bacterium NBWT11]
MTPVWYAAYGSNTLASRFDCYLRGGRPAGGARTYPGCRDTAPPRASTALRVPGRLVFGGTSTVWGGGMAFLDDVAPGTAPARAWLVTAGQFADVAAQEMHAEPGTVALDAVPVGRHHLGPGRYETVVRLGDRDGVPVLTLTCPEPPPPAPPSAAYLRVLAAGLVEAGWPAAAVVDHLAVASTWARADVAALLVPAP